MEIYQLRKDGISIKMNLDFDLKDDPEVKLDKALTQLLLVDCVEIIRTKLVRTDELTLKMSFLKQNQNEIEFLIAIVQKYVRQNFEDDPKFVKCQKLAQ